MMFEKIRERLSYFVGLLAVVASLGLLFILIYDIIRQGGGALSWDFITNFPSRFPAQAGVRSALFGTAWVMIMTAFISIPLGVFTGIYLEEFLSRGVFKKFIEVNISNLAGVPSIVYGMLGLAVFVRAMALGRSVLSGALTMSLLILPVIVIATVEALKSVPTTLRWAAFGVGASRRQVVFSHVLPQAFPGICTGVILALSRAIGESAPLILIGALSYVAFVPENPMDSFTVLAIQTFNWASRPQEAFHERAAAAIIVLLILTLAMNGLAIYLRARFAGRKGAR